MPINNKGVKRRDKKYSIYLLNAITNLFIYCINTIFGDQGSIGINLWE